MVRLRMGAIELGHKNGKRTRARLQHCIGCQVEITDVYEHAVFQCPAHVVLRGLLFAVWVQPARVNREALLDFLSIPPCFEWFAAAVHLAVALDMHSASFFSM